MAGLVVARPVVEAGRSAGLARLEETFGFSGAAAASVLVVGSAAGSAASDGGAWLVSLGSAGFWGSSADSVTFCAGGLSGGLTGGFSGCGAGSADAAAGASSVPPLGFDAATTTTVTSASAPTAAATSR